MWKEVSRGTWENLLRTLDGGNVPFPGFLIGVWALSVGCDGALNPLPACCLLLWDFLCTPPKNQLQWFGPLWDLLQPGTWRTGSFPGIIAGPMEEHLHFLHLHGYSPPYCLILWGVEWLSPQV